MISVGSDVEVPVSPSTMPLKVDMATHSEAEVRLHVQGCPGEDVLDC